MGPKRKRENHQALSGICTMMMAAAIAGDSLPP